MLYAALEEKAPRKGGYTYVVEIHGRSLWRNTQFHTHSGFLLILSVIYAEEWSVDGYELNVLINEINSMK